MRGIDSRTALAALALALGVSSGEASAAPPSPAQPLARPSYELHARLDPEAGVLHGHARIRWPNRSRAPVRELYFHLYPNAFASTRTLFMREGGRRIREQALSRPGGMELRTLELVEADGARVDLLRNAERELIPDDRTQLRATLPAPLAPGAGLELEIAFELRLPSLVARMGQAGEFCMIAQWFPKLAKHEPDGRWVSFPYHGLGEFYADFADHTLELEVPSDYVVAAPGQLLDRSERSAGTRVERYRLDDALDVAWAAYPDFRRERARAGDVELEAFAPPGHTALMRAQLALVKSGLAALGKRLGPYPYGRIVLVLPPAAAHGASGMEYPGLVVGATASWHSELSVAGSVAHDITTTHELAHQWFPLLIASNELQLPVLDEGLAEWLGLELLRARYGRSSAFARLIGLPADSFELLRAGFARGAADLPSSLLPAWRYRPVQLGPAVYARPALVLESVRRTYGADRLWRALGRYARAERHAHPGLDALLAAFDASYRPGFGRDVLVPLLAGEHADVRLTRSAANCGTAVQADRTGDGPALPTTFTAVARDGGRSVERWPESARRLELDCDPQRIGAERDAERSDLLDRTRLDDQLRLAAHAPRPAWLARLLLWAQLLLAAVGA